MKNQNNQKTEALKFELRRGNIVSMLGAAMVFCAILGCNISEFKIGEKTKTGGKGRNNTAGNTKSSDKSGDSRDAGETTEERRLREDLAVLAQQFYRSHHVGDAAELERILSDDFIIKIDGENVSKKDLIKGSRGDKNWISAQAKDTRLVTNEGNRAELEFTMIVEYTDRIVTETCQDEFVKNDKWQIRKIFSCSDKFTTKNN